MIDPIFRLRCVDCDALGVLSRLWLRTSIEVKPSGHASSSMALHDQIHHYVECMNCGAHLKSRQSDCMENVADAEWKRIVVDVVDADEIGSGLPSGMQRIT